MNSLDRVNCEDNREDQLPAAELESTAHMPCYLLADDATSADQVALSVCESLGRRVVTIDAGALSQRGKTLARGYVWVINTGTRALSPEEALALNQSLATRLFPGEGNLPFLQIDSRLRGVGNALRGIYESLDFACLLFVPAEPELGRLVQGGYYYHLEDGRRTPFHQSVLASSVGRPFTTSDLRDYIASELGIAKGRVLSIGNEVISKGADAIVECFRRLDQPGKWVAIPDVDRPEHFEAVISAKKQCGRGKILLAGSRTCLRSYFASLVVSQAGGHPTARLSQAIDKQNRGAPLAAIGSLEPATKSQVEYAQRALGPNLITVVFDPGVILRDDRAIRREKDRVHRLALHSLKAMRPVLIRSSGDQTATGAALERKLLHAISGVVADEALHRYMTSLLISGGQTAETIRKALGVAAVEIKGNFQDSIPWGTPVGGSCRHMPLVTKGGRLGSDAVLFDFFEQGHPLPRANILPVVTPLTSDREIDEAGIERLVHYLVRLGTTDIFAVGNAGEFRFLANDQRLQALEIFSRKARGKLRVFAGVTGDSAEETRRNYEAASRLGVFAAVIMPLYFLKRSEEILPFVESLRAIRPGLPLVLYNNPERTGGENISFADVEVLPFPVVAIKDSSGDLARLDRYASALPVYQGQQRQFLEGYLHGARGTVAIVGHVNSLPNEFFGPTTTAARRAEITGCINDLSKTLKQGAADVAAYKFLLSQMGVIGDTVASREPARELTAAQRELIRERNKELISRGLALSAPPLH